MVTSLAKVRIPVSLVVDGPVHAEWRVEHNGGFRAHLSTYWLALLRRDGTGYRGWNPHSFPTIAIDAQTSNPMLPDGILC